ncbi:MAG TPA: acyl transferase [Chitinophagaceae bacterium]|jgi:phenylacetate-coenzyme A ligase PaaK-like adenylate-forming protein|nr:acyl transferase [Chitinophagaceae bacterium]
MEIPKAADLLQQAFTLQAPQDLYKTAVRVFYYQYHHNSVYRSFCSVLGRHPGNVHQWQDIPFLPISFFKTQAVRDGDFTPEAVFTSSGTTGAATSRHEVRSLALYERSFRQAFEQFYGAPSRYCLLGLLPAYLERGGSSLVYMVDRLIGDSGHPLSGFYLHDHERLAQTLQTLEAAGQPTLLIGVTYALLDFAERYPMPLRHTLLMETGGMKGRREELLRSEVHERLQAAFGVPAVHSEYGMTELLSQAYSAGAGRFGTPPWMKVLLREEDDPFALHAEGPATRSGAASIIDLANLHSCSFIATDDLCRLHPDGSFEIAGRIDHSDVRGCSLLAV